MFWACVERFLETLNQATFDSSMKSWLLLEINHLIWQLSLMSRLTNRPLEVSLDHGENRNE
jgi:hypothetical protein